MELKNENLKVAYNTLHEWGYGGYGHTKVSCDIAEHYTLYKGMERECVTKRLYLITNNLELVEAATSPEYYFESAEWDNYESEQEAKLLLLLEVFSQWHIADDFQEEIEELEELLYN